MKGFSRRIKRLINREGRSITHRTYTNSGVDDFNPTQTPSDTTVVGIVFDFESTEIDGSIIQQHDKEIVIASDQVINKEDKIIDNGIEYSIVAMEETQPGDDVFMYIIQGRA